MKRKYLRGIMILLTAILAGTALRAGQSPDETEIRKVELGLQEAWNHHDMKAWANLFTEDADFVNVAGWWWKGRAQIEKKHTEIHAYIFRDSTLTIDEVDTKFLTPEIAIVHSLWSLSWKQESGWKRWAAAEGDFHAGAAKAKWKMADCRSAEYRQPARSADADGATEEIARAGDSVGWLHTIRFREFRAAGKEMPLTARRARKMRRCDGKLVLH